MRQFKLFLIIFVSVVVLYSCSPADGNRTGHEYMPDMAHSIAYESNLYSNYYLNTWDSASVFLRKDLSGVRLPVKGTIPRGYAGYMNADASQFEGIHDMLRGGTNKNAIAVPLNSYVPYHYADTEEERTRASLEIINNPFPITAAGLEKGKELYTIQCGICHGEKGDGLGYLVSDANPNAKYPAAPANFLQDTFYNSSNGRYYHAIIYGKNVMGGYADKLDFEERWQVIHYIRSLQAKEKKLAYSADANTFNPAYGMPEKQFKAIAATRQTDVAPVPGDSVKVQQTPQQTEGHNGGGSHDE
ncbi:MAG: c-type cytochrome [Saprospiraceae bacterium]|nr:c-type cytochrome [Saprospiraceae bacterium]